MDFVKIDSENRQAVTDFISRQWLSTEMVLRGQVIDMTAVDGIAAFLEGQIVGLITWRPLGNALEILSLDSLLEGKGTGTRLVEKAVEFARKEGLGKVLVITTNDNLKAIGFYQKRGFDFARIYRNALDISRKIKPQIPMTGENGIPLKHEIEFEYIL